jgi:CO/xanthine dehydrogenase Mo-binding subunit
MPKDYNSLDSRNTRKTLSVHLIRSSIPRGTISSITIPELPKGFYSISWEDIPGDKNISVFSEEMPLLCNGQINYEGEPILAICGPEEKDVLDICKDISIEYETDYSLLSFENHQNSQIAGIKKFTKGGVESKFKAINQIIEGEYRSLVQMLPITYPIGAIASYKNNILEISTASQWPFHIQKTVSDICLIPKKSIEVNIEPYYHTYDEKLIIPTVYATIAALFAIKSGKQVRFISEPSETLQFTVKRPLVKINRKSALNQSGKIIAEDIIIDVDMGAYPIFTDEILSQLILGAASIYSVSNLRITARAIRSSSPPMNVFKGCSIGSAVFSAETHYSRIAAQQQINPVELRLNYMQKANQKLPSGGSLKQVSQRDILLKVMEISDFNRKYSAYEVLKKSRKGSLDKQETLRGIGIAIAYAGNGFTKKRENRDSYSVSVKLDKNNKLYISSSSNGSTPENIWKETAGNILGLDSQSIEIVRGNNTILPNSGPSFLSNDLSIMTNLVEKCCNGIKKQRFQQALPIIEKRSFKSPGKNVWDENKLKGMPFNGLSWGAAVIEIELDPVFLIPLIRGIWTIFDIGKIYNIDAACSAGEAEIYESLAWVSGGVRPEGIKKSITGLLDGQRSELPKTHIECITDSKRAACGISQIPDTIIPSAYVQAVSQASGIYFDTIPVTPETIFQYLDKK